MSASRPRCQRHHAACPDRGHAVRHNPFVHFRGIIDSTTCAKRVVDLSRLTGDLGRVATTPNYAYITPNPVNDGHDAPCVDGRPGGLTSVDAWLKVWVPRILASPAFTQDGGTIITADEADSPKADASACCGRVRAQRRVARDHRARRYRVAALVRKPVRRAGHDIGLGLQPLLLLASTEDLFGLPISGMPHRRVATIRR